MISVSSIYENSKMDTKSGKPGKNSYYDFTKGGVDS